MTPADRARWSAVSRPSPPALLSPPKVLKSPSAPKVPGKITPSSVHHDRPPPLDFTFRGIWQCKALLTASPRGKHVPTLPTGWKAALEDELRASDVQVVHDEEEEVTVPPEPVKLKSKDLRAVREEALRWLEYPTKEVETRFKYLSYKTESLQLAGNELPDATGLVKFVNVALWGGALSITSLNLSQNFLTTIPEEISEFANLRYLYLQANKIGDMVEVQKLASNCRLHSLCIHGNPIEVDPLYKWCIIDTLPFLHCLDSSTITRKERESAPQYLKRGRRKLDFLPILSTLPKYDSAAPSRQPPPPQPAPVALSASQNPLLLTRTKPATPPDEFFQ